jgi:hypothetical protein
MTKRRPIPNALAFLHEARGDVRPSAPQDNGAMATQQHGTAATQESSAAAPADNGAGAQADSSPSAPQGNGATAHAGNGAMATQDHSTTAPRRRRPAAHRRNGTTAQRDHGAAAPKSGTLARPRARADGREMVNVTFSLPVALAKEIRVFAAGLEPRMRSEWAAECLRKGMRRGG